jgi:hypothetical protein
LLGVFGVYEIGDLMHFFLLGGLMMLSIAFLKAREAAAQRGGSDRSHES